MAERSKSHFNNFIRSKDIFANKVDITFNGDKKYKTPYGGALALISATLMFSWLIYQFIVVRNIDFTAKNGLLAS